ncbi:MAG TPA: serine/threonine-protein kinase [Candidatus Pacearchaeota archaeon]|nr:serine/threonine-protein kinase [Candidatus Pacearchaeota archaeon]
MEIGETYTAQSGRKYHVLERIATTDGAKIFTARSLNERGRPIRVVKNFRRHGGLGEFKLEREREILTYLNQINSGEDYPGVIKLLDYSEEELSLILEYARGGDLDDSIDYRGVGGFDLAKAVTIIKQLSGTLSRMFRNEGIVHRDLKPGNVLLSESVSRNLRGEEQGGSLEELAQAGGMKLCDFSLALKCDRDTGKYESEVHERKRPSCFIGTPLYCSPKIIRGERGDERSDVWALGVIAYELLVKGGAFNRNLPLEKLLGEINNFQFPKKIKRDLCGFERVMYAMMQKNPEDRITAEEIHYLASEFERRVLEFSPKTL